MFVCFYPLFCWLVSHGNHHVLTHVQCFFWDWSHSNNDDLKLQKKNEGAKSFLEWGWHLNHTGLENLTKEWITELSLVFPADAAFQTHRKPSHTESNLVMDSVPRERPQWLMTPSLPLSLIFLIIITTYWRIIECLRKEEKVGMNPRVNKWSICHPCKWIICFN